MSWWPFPKPRRPLRPLLIILALVYALFILLHFTGCTSHAATLTVSGGGDLRAAAQRLRPGDTLLVQPGVYGGGLGCEIPSGSEGAPTIIRASVPGQAIIRLSNGGRGIDLGCSQQWIVIDGLVITGEDQSTGEGIHLTDTSHVTVQNTDIGHILGNGTCAPSQGIAFSESNNNVFLNNRIHDLGHNDPPSEVRSCNFTYGTYMPSNGNLWDSNLFYNISAFAIHGYPDPQNNIIRNNTLCNTGPLLMRGSGNVIEGNRLFHVGRTVYPFEQGQTIMSSSGNSTSNNQISDGDGNCAAMSPPQRPGPPSRPRLPAPRNLRILPR
jgi:Right handed beta helix region